MIAVIFEAWPKEGQQNEYFDLATQLKSSLIQIEGFDSVERFQSIANPGKLLSLSFWKDEKSIAQWRNVQLHRQAQSEGRDFIFADYRLRVANVVRDYGINNRKEAPADSKLIH